MSVDPATLHIVRYPADVLRRRAEPVPAIDDTVRAVALRMIELMHDAEGVGLAAPQVGLPWRLFVCRGVDEDDAEDVFVNPVLSLLPSALVGHEEGCLSLPGINAEIRRPESARIEATGLDGAPLVRAATGFVARVWQHEYDHIEGVLIIDRMLPRDRLATRRQLKSLEAGTVA